MFSLSSVVAFFNLLCIIRLSPSNKINKRKENLIQISLFFIIFVIISDSDFVVEYEFMIYDFAKSYY